MFELLCGVSIVGLLMLALCACELVFPVVYRIVPGFKRWFDELCLDAEAWDEEHEIFEEERA